ncbi:MAG: diguanylate cyclase [Gammaproteobacteria bacterium]|jgi:diguanylate cyclase (GGDEF)-like protein
MDAKPLIEELAIIIVDDMQFSRAVLKNSLERRGYADIRMAASGAEVLALLRQRGADVVLADWVMPEMNGLELADAIRSLDEQTNRYTSIILFTAKEGGEALVEAFQHGVDDYLTKPVHELELAGRVHAAGRISTLQNTLLITTQALELDNRHLRTLSMMDELTGLGNRRHLDEELAAHLKHVHARGGGLCLAMLDIDHFKAVNDTYGHESGDALLRSVATRLRRAVRPTDSLARISGQQFAAVLYYPESGQFRPSVFDRILSDIGNRPFYIDDQEIHITASIGVSCVMNGIDAVLPSPEELFAQTEHRLQEAKQQGRNRIVIG